MSDPVPLTTFAGGGVGGGLGFVICAQAVLGVVSAVRGSAGVFLHDGAIQHFQQHDVLGDWIDNPIGRDLQAEGR